LPRRSLGEGGFRVFGEENRELEVNGPERSEGPYFNI